MRMCVDAASAAAQSVDELLAPKGVRGPRGKRASRDCFRLQFAAEFYFNNIVSYIACILIYLYISIRDSHYALASAFSALFWITRQKGLYKRFRMYNGSNRSFKLHLEARWRRLLDYREKSVTKIIIKRNMRMRETHPAWGVRQWNELSRMRNCATYIEVARVHPYCW